MNLPPEAFAALATGIAGTVASCALFIRAWVLGKRILS